MFEFLAICKCYIEYIYIGITAAVMLLDKAAVLAIALAKKYRMILSSFVCKSITIASTVNSFAL